MLRISKKECRYQQVTLWVILSTIFFLGRLSRSWALTNRNTGTVSRGTCISQRMASISTEGKVQSLGDFLKQQDASSANHVVLGNEAGDADSIISALSLSFVDSMQSKSLMPLVSIKRADLCLRRETVLLLELVGVDTDKLIYVDDDETLLNTKRKVTLVDHNSLAKDYSSWDPVEILDHHLDMGNHKHVKGDLRQIAFEGEHASVGSTCTLIAERMKTLSTSGNSYRSDLSLALLGPILLDTVNMSPEAHKGTERDQVAIDALVQNTDWSDLPDQAAFLRGDSDAPDLAKFYEYLRDSKFDPAFWNDLSVIDSLRLDYKRFQHEASGNIFGASSVLLPMKSFVSKKDLASEIKQYMELADIPLLAVLSMTVVDDAPKREMLLAGNDTALLDSMASFLLQQSDMLGLTEVSTENLKGDLVIRQFTQANARASRKQTVPIMFQFYDQQEN